MLERLTPAGEPQVLEVAGFVLDARERRLLDFVGSLVAIASRAFDLLLDLARATSRVTYQPDVDVGPARFDPVPRIVSRSRFSPTEQM